MSDLRGDAGDAQGERTEPVGPGDRATRDGLDVQRGSDPPRLPVEIAARLRAFGDPPRALPALVDARIRAAIDDRARPRRRIPAAARWAAAAIVAATAGAGLGRLSWPDLHPSVTAEPRLADGRSSAAPWVDRSEASASGSEPSAPSASNRRARRPTIVDALMAERAARGESLAPELHERLDVDHNGRIDASDVAILARRAVAVAPRRDDEAGEGRS